MMINLILILGILLLPMSCGSSDLIEINQVDCTIIGDKVYPTTDNFQRIYTNVRKYQDHDTAILFAKALATKKLWRELTAIAEVESGYDIYAVGKAGEQGAFQIKPNYHGQVPREIFGQCRQSEKVLQDFIKNSPKSIIFALNKYGGDATLNQYAYKVLKVSKRI